MFSFRLARFLRLIPTLISFVLKVIIEVGPDKAEINFCKALKLRFADLPKACLHGVLEGSSKDIILGLMFVVGLVWFFWPQKESKADEELKPDMNLNEAIDYIVNDSVAKLKGPEPARIGDSGPGKGHLIMQRGVEHSDAWTKLNERLNSGRLKIWGLRETQIPNQFEATLREINPEYWDRMQLNFLSCFHHTKSLPQTVQIPGKQADLQWTNLMVSSAEIFRAWPRRAWPYRLWQRITSRPRMTYWE